MSTIPQSSSGSHEASSSAPPSVEAAAEGRTRWHLPKGALAIAALALAGAMVFLYPATAAWLSQYDQSRVISELGTNGVRHLPQEQAEALIAARQYNDELVSSAELVANERKPFAEGGAAADPRYESLLNGDANGAMGRLRIPAIAVDLPIYHGTDDETLARGVGHLRGTSLPVGGPSTHSVLTAHRGLAEATLFDRLDELGIDDTFRIEVFGEVLTYRVIETKVVEPSDTASLVPRYGQDLVTLVTCTPLGINSHRILVTGERVIPTPVADVQQAGAAPDIPGLPWWAIGLGGTVVVLTYYVWRAGRPRASRPRARAAADG